MSIYQDCRARRNEVKLSIAALNFLLLFLLRATTSLLAFWFFFCLQPILSSFHTHSRVA